MHADNLRIGLLHPSVCYKMLREEVILFLRTFQRTKNNYRDINLYGRETEDDLETDFSGWIVAILRNC